MSKGHQSLTIDEVWEKLINDIEHLFQYQKIRYSQWMLIYTHIFDYCTNTKYGNDQADLYEYLRNYLRNYLENLCQSVGNLQNDDILKFYLNQWKKYRVSSKILHGICSYLHRNYIPRERDSGNQTILEIYPLAMHLWQQIVSQVFYPQITEICLNMIKTERNQQKIDTELISNVIQTYITLDIKQDLLVFHNNNEKLDVYQEYFENQFLIDTQEFYRLQSTNYLQQHSVIEYLAKIPQYFDEEICRVASYLHSSTTIKLIKVLEQILIHDQLTIINTEAKNLIHDEKVQELKLLYQTVNRIKNGTMELKNLLENHIYQIAIQTIERINPISTNDFKVYIQTIYDLHQKYYTFIQQTFDSNHEFFNILDRSCRKFVNNNLVVQTLGNMTIMAEHLARYCDKLLRKRREEEEEINLEMIFKQIGIVLCYMQEKDIFGKFCLKLLAKRLIHQMNISLDDEILMISNIQNSCSYEYLYKMKQMCQDIEISRNTLDQYQKTQRFNQKINFNVLILNSNAWGFSIPSNVHLSIQLEFLINSFDKFYKNIYKGRKLILLYQHSKGELKTFFTDKIYKLQVSTYQMMILLMYNNTLELTIEEIHNETQIETNLLFQILNSLIQSKILVSKQSIDQINLNKNSIIKLSTDFTSDKYSINLNIPIKSIEQHNTEIFTQQIDQDRIILIQAAIVRIMKLHKIMNQNLLIQTVIEQLHSHFNPNISMIKNCIDMLIEKDYLERSSHSQDLLNYIT